MRIDDRALVEYLRRSYHAVDGLWFVKVEEDHGFEAALEFDQRVWQVLAKIQARKARELTNACDNGPETLARCFTLKLTADGHDFAAEVTGEGVLFRIAECPWLALLRKAGRTHLAQPIAEAVCRTEGNVWCAEFGGAYVFDMPQMSCAGGTECHMRFTRQAVAGLGPAEGR